MVSARVVSWVVLILLMVLGILYAPILVLVGVSACCAGLAAVEFCNLVRGITGSARVLPLALSCGIAVVMTGYEFRDVGPGVVAAVLGVVLITSGSPYLLWGNPVRVFKMVLSETIGLIYLGFTLSYIPMIVDAVNGRAWLLYGVIIVSATDTGAYVFGRIFGRHPLAPSISPAKTIEGALGGWVSGVCFSLSIAKVFSLGMGIWVSMCLGAVLSALGQLGDLVESKLKRMAGVKDSGRIIPGQGGILDRIDSVVLVLPVLYYVSRAYIS